MNKSIIRPGWALLMIIIFSWSVFLPSLGMKWTDVAYAADSDDDILLFMPAILAGARNAKQPLTVLVPNGGETLTSGDFYDISWTASSLIKTVDIEFSENSGETYTYTIAKGTPNDGVYTWFPVPFHDAGRLGSTFKIRIKDSENPNTVMDESDGVFSIQDASSPMLLGQLQSINDSLATDPAEKDSDGDGLYDNVELYLGTDPLNWDSDIDGFDDYYEVFGDLIFLPVPDADSDGIIAALDNDDNNDGRNDGRDVDSDLDGIPDYLEIYGFTYEPTSQLKYFLWDGDITKTYYKTNPIQASTDQDQYSDDVEVSKVNMDMTVKEPGDNPMVAAFPNFVVKMTDYTVTLNSTITETDGTVHTDASTWDQTLSESTSTTDEYHWEVGEEVSGSLTDFGGSVSASYGESHSTTKTKGTARSNGGEMSTAKEWSQATCTNPTEAALIKLNLRIRNVGTCAAQDVYVTMNLQIGGKNIKTMTYPAPLSPPITRILPGGNHDWVSESLPLTMDELRALRTGAAVTIEITDISGEVVKNDGQGYVQVGDWGTYFAAAENVSAHLFLDLGDGNTTEQLVYAGEGQWEPIVTLRDALVWAANGYETSEGPYIRFYQPDGSLGDPASLDGWYFSLDTGTYDSISSYIRNPDFNFFDTVLNSDSVVVAKAPPINPTPRIHWGVLSPLDGTVTAYADDYFFNQDYLTVEFIDKYGTSSPMTWDAESLTFSVASPLNTDGTAYVKDGTEKIRARNSIYYNHDDPRWADYQTVLPVSQMSYIPSFEHAYPPVSWAETNYGANNVSVSGDYAYTVASTYHNIAVIDVNPTSDRYLKVVRSLDLNGSGYIDLFVSGNYLFVSSGSSLLIFDVTDPENLSISNAVIQEFPGKSLTKVFVSGNYAYVTYSEVDETKGLQVIDVTDPANPNPLGSYHVLSGDLTDLFVSGNYAYVTYNGVDGTKGLQVINVTDPANPTFEGSYDTPDPAQKVFVSGNYAYVIYSNGADSSGLQVIDVTDPANPTPKGSCAIHGSVQGHDAVQGIFVSGNYAYVTVMDDLLQVINISDPDNPNPAGSCDVIIQSNNGKSLYGLFVSGDYAYVCYSGGIQLIDVSDPGNPHNTIFSGKYDTPGYAWGVFVSDNYAYVADGASGLTVIDLTTDPADPTIRTYATPSPASDVKVSGDYAYIASASGLQIIDLTSDPTDPTIVTYATSYDLSDVFVSGNYAYVTDWLETQVIDVTNPLNPTLIGSCNTPSQPYGVYVSGNYAYVADRGSGLQVIDINPESGKYLTIVGSYDTPGQADDVYVAGDYAYVADSEGGLQIIDVTDPANPTLKGSYTYVDSVLGKISYFIDVFVSGNYAYVADGNGNGFRVIDVTDPAHPTLEVSYDTPDSARKVFVSGGYVYIADYRDGLRVINFR